MANKPITVERFEYMQKIVEATNAAELPAFVKVDVLKQTIAELSNFANTELKRDLESYRASMKMETSGSEVSSAASEMERRCDQ
jgi:hypothetical protein